MSTSSQTQIIPNSYLSSLNKHGVVDTSLLLEELKREYRKKGKPVEVDFRALVHWVRLGDQKTHLLHPYPAKLLPNIAHFFVHADSISKRSTPILDPFCGSGTVALEASLAGRIPYVADANPLALLIAKVKTTPYDVKRLRCATEKLIARAARLRTAPQIAIVNEDIWYRPEKKRSLEIILRAIEEVQNKSHRDFFKVCFSVTARRLSLADPAISVPVRLKTKEGFTKATNSRITEHIKWIKETLAIDEFFRVCESNIKRVEESNSICEARPVARVVGRDARQLIAFNEKSKPLESNSIPLVITSPPYGSAQKYIRATSLSLNWLSLANPEHLSELESASIGREHLPIHRQQELTEILPKKYERLLRKVGKINSRRESITRYYLCEMASALREISRVTAPGGHAVLVIGNNQVCGEALRNDDYVTSVLLESGMKTEVHLIDHIKSRGLMTKRNKTASVISRESVLVFSK